MIFVQISLKWSTILQLSHFSNKSMIGCSRNRSMSYFYAATIPIRTAFYMEHHFIAFPIEYRKSQMKSCMQEPDANVNSLSQNDSCSR